MTREVEARLKLSAVDRTQKAFDSVQRRLKAVEKQTSAFARTNAAIERSAGSMLGSLKVMGGAAVAGGILSAEASSFTTMATAANERLRADTVMLLDAGADRDFLSTFLEHAFAKAQLDLAEHLLTLAADEAGPLRKDGRQWAH